MPPGNVRWERRDFVRPPLPTSKRAGPAPGSLFVAIEVLHCHIAPAGDVTLVLLHGQGHQHSRTASWGVPGDCQYLRTAISIESRSR